MGFAGGQLMKDQLGTVFDKMWKYLEDMVASYIKYFPEEIRDWIANFGLDAALDLTAEITKPYTSPRFEEEIKGWAAGSGVSEALIRRLNMLPELTKAACTMFGAWGNATSATGGSLFQLRALDWDVNAPIKDMPAVVVYHPVEGDGHAFANIGWPGMIGSLTGYSSSSIGISEKVWLTDEDVTSRFGTPWTYVLRDVLQYANELDDALSMLANAHRTCAIHVGVGDSVTGQFRGIEYAYKALNIYDDNNQPTYADHPHFEGLVYWDKHKQPTHDPCLPALLQKYYGSINAENTIQNIAAEFETGNAQVAVYDFAKDLVYVANPRADGESGPLDAYARQYVRFDMKQIFAEPRP